MTDSTSETPAPDADPFATPGGTTPPPTGADGDETTSPAPAPATAPGETVRAPRGNKGSGRYAVYDLVLTRYVGDVMDSKPSAATARELSGGHSYRIVEV